MDNYQTAEERELIAKWNAGDYATEGWVNNTDGLTEEALQSLAEYNTQKYCGLNSLDAEQLLADSSDTGTLALPENFAAIADACMSVLTGRVNNVPAVIAEVFHPFAPGFGRFRAVFERQGKAGHANVNGQVRWTQSAVSGTAGSAVLQKDPGPQHQVVLSAVTPGFPPEARLQFTGSSDKLKFKQPFRGTGRYTT